jgi:hypothetical protein
VVLAAPGTASAQAYAHDQLREHAEHQGDDGGRHHHGNETADKAAAIVALSHDYPAAALQSSDSAGDHDHPELIFTLSARPELSHFIATAPQATVRADIVFVTAASLLLITTPARAGPPFALSRQPRAPPTS